MRDIFDLDIFGDSSYSESYSGDIMDMPLDEETEFAEPESKIDHHYDPKNSVSGAMKGGDLELTDDQFNDAIDAVQKSIKSDHKIMEKAQMTLKESYQLLEALRSATIIPGSSQENFTEAALLQAYEDGPWFEAAAENDPDEKVCKKKAKALRGDFIKIAKANGIETVKVSVLMKGEVKKEDQVWKIVGIFIGDKASDKDQRKKFVDDVVKKIERKMEDGYGLLPVKATEAQLAAINAKRKSPVKEAWIVKLHKA